MSSEHAIERVPLSEIREGDMLQDPKSGNWIKITRTADDSTEYRVYYGDGGEEIDSRSITGLVNRQVRE
jgi:hypothetical protein